MRNTKQSGYESLNLENVSFLNSDSFDAKVCVLSFLVTDSVRFVGFYIAILQP